MLQPKVFFAIAMFVLTSFLIRPAFSAGPVTSTMTADCSIKSLSGEEIEASKKMQVQVQELGDNSAKNDSDREAAFLSITDHSLSANDRRTLVLDLEVFEDTASGKRVYRATTYQKMGFRSAAVYKTTGSNEFTSTDKKVRIKTSDYTAKKTFDCSLE